MSVCLGPLGRALEGAACRSHPLCIVLPEVAGQLAVGVGLAGESPRIQLLNARSWYDAEPVAE